MISPNIEACIRYHCSSEKGAPGSFWKGKKITVSYKKFFFKDENHKMNKYRTNKRSERNNYQQINIFDIDNSIKFIIIQYFIHYGLLIFKNIVLKHYLS